MNIENVLSLIGGLGLFLYGMTVMGDSIEKAAGAKMRSFLGVSLPKTGLWACCLACCSARLCSPQALRRLWWSALLMQDL